MPDPEVASAPTQEPMTAVPAVLIKDAEALLAAITACEAQHGGLLTVDTLRMANRLHLAIATAKTRASSFEVSTREKK